MMSLFSCLIGSAFAEENYLPDTYTDDQPNNPILGLSYSKPFYFLVGEPHTKIQLSFKTKLSAQAPIYFAYSQLMMWDLLRASPFFYDLNYNPIFFYRFMINEERKERIDFIPWEHESNGRGGEAEKTWDRIAVNYHRAFLMRDSRTSLNLSMKIWAPLRYQSLNPDLPRYRGLWQIEVGWTNFLRDEMAFSDLVLRFYPGGKSRTNPIQGGQELTYRMQVSLLSFLPLIVAQVFHGYGENLQDYRKEKWKRAWDWGFELKSTCVSRLRAVIAYVEWVAD